MLADHDCQRQGLSANRGTTRRELLGDTSLGHWSSSGGSATASTGRRRGEASSANRMTGAVAVAQNWAISFTSRRTTSLFDQWRSCWAARGAAQACRSRQAFMTRDMGVGSAGATSSCGSRNSHMEGFWSPLHVQVRKSLECFK